MARKFSAAIILLCAAAAAGCGGGAVVPQGSVRNYVPAPGPAITSATVQVAITVPTTNGTSVRPQDISAGTQSVAFTLASVNGIAVSGQTRTVLDVAPGAPNCTSTSTGRVCTGQVQGAVGEDAFTVDLYPNSDGSGALLAGGTVTVSVAASGSTLALDASTTASLAPIVASLKVSIAGTGFTYGVAGSTTVTVSALDASGATIVGASPIVSPITLSVGGAPSGAFSFSASTLTSLNQTVTLSYDGSSGISASPNLAVSATLTQAGSTISSSAAIPVKNIPEPTPTPVGGGHPILYVLNQGGTGATVAEFDPTANGNVAPLGVLQLSSTMTAQSIATDPSGKLHVGYAEGEIDTYAAGASGTAAPLSTLSGDSNSSTVLTPVAMTFDGSGDLFTIGQTMLDNNGGSTAVLMYASGASGTAPPTTAWNFNNPYVSLAGTANAFVSGMAVDASGNVYIAGALQNSSLSSAEGVYVGAGTASTPYEPTLRTIPGDAITTIPATPSDGTIAGIALDAAGRIYESQYTGSSSANLMGAVNVFPAGATSGTTDTAPLQTIGGAPLALTGAGVAALPIALSATNIYVANGAANSIAVYPLRATGAATPAQTIAGSATQLNAPIGIALGSSSPVPAVRTRRPGAFAAGMSRRFRGASTTNSATKTQEHQ